MFPLQERKIGGYTFLQPTFYGTKHTGTDYKANYVNYFAPFSGTATKGWGPEGGNWWQLIRPNGDKFIARHLLKVLKTGTVHEGDLVAVTGNTGQFTTNAHLHQEVYINNKLVDPEKYPWDTMPTYPIPIKVAVVINQPEWLTVEAKILEIQNWYTSNSQNKLSLGFIIKYTDFPDVPFKTLPDGSAVIDEPWFDANVLDPLADTTVFVVKDSDLPDNFPGGFKLVARTSGFMGEKPTKTVVACSEFEQSEIYPAIGAFVDYVRHELMHTCYFFSGEHIGNEYFGQDYTHKYFYDQKFPEGAFSQLDYEHIFKTINKTSLMAQIKTQGKGASRRIVLEAADLNEWKVLAKVYGKDPNKLDEVV